MTRSSPLDLPPVVSFPERELFMKTEHGSSFRPSRVMATIYAGGYPENGSRGYN